MCAEPITGLFTTVLGWLRKYRAGIFAAICLVAVLGGALDSCGARTAAMRTARGYLDSLTGWVASFDRRSAETAKAYEARLKDATEERDAAIEDLEALKGRLGAARTARKQAFKPPAGAVELWQRFDKAGYPGAIR